MSDSVLVTGASGFIGTTIREALATSAEHGMFSPGDVVCVDREKPVEMWRGETWPAPVDLLDVDRVEEVLRWYRPTHVVHAAAQARVGPSLEDALATYRLNVEATMNLLDACDRLDVDHFVYLSSEAIYGEAREYPTPENSDFRPINPYAASKVAADVMVQEYRGLETCVLRSGMGWGPRSNPAEQVVAKFICKALDDEPLLFPEGDVDHPTRDLNHVKDFADGLLSVLDQEATGVYNLSGGREYSVLEIAEAIVDHVGAGRVEFTDEFEYRAGEEGFRTWLDVSKAADELGHKPSRHLGGDALENTVDWYREHRDKGYWS